MTYPVFMITEAEDDVLDVFRFVQTHESLERAYSVLDGIERAVDSLKEHPERGHIPPELDRIGVRTFREIHFKPWRVIYQILGERVFIHAVLDGRRSLQQLLERRLMR